MKKILIILTILFFSFKLSAWERQSDTTVLVSFRIGYSISNVISSDPNTMNSCGYNPSLIFHLHMHQEITLHTGIAYFSKGYEAQKPHYNFYNDYIGNYPTFYSFDYLNIPFNFQYNLGRRKFNVYINGGFDINFLLKQRTYAYLPDFVEGVPVDPFDIINTNYYKSMVFGIHGGGGIEYKLYPALSFILDFKYYKDFSNSYKSGIAGELKHTGYALGLGIKIGIPVKFIVT